MMMYPVRGLAAIMMVVLSFGSAWAGSPINKVHGVAIFGFDPVAYFTMAEAVEGSREFTYRWGDAEWRFASAENRDLFAADPEKYAPAYGGYCAYAVSQGMKVGIDPEAWQIVDGVNYLNQSDDVRRAWNQDLPYYIALGNEMWPEIINDDLNH